MHLLNYKIFYFISEFNCEHILKIRKNINLIFRNYEKNFDLTYYKKLKNFCHTNGYKIYLSNNVQIAHNLGFDGVYIPAFNSKFIINKNFRTSFKILGSAHNIKEIRQKEKQGANYIFLSPIFYKNNKKSLGIIKFKNLSKKSFSQIVALGGINKHNINKLNLINIKCFASINFVKNLYEK